ncbi:FliH/SctL family protein [Nocardioides pantholopis]|uniref:FliH/SctL family protein n=1 Tax=Nocardioides pantholopis TaxID=2483798 RepID=UPI000FDBB197|nr:FliH/SctL family protein [Nocardioides pantholopis]
MTSSSEALLRGPEAGAVRRPGSPELRTGTWTRLGDAAVLGDETTEHALSQLAEATRSAARSQGYAVGWAQGRREATETARAAQHRLAEEHAAAEARREREHRQAVAGLVRAAELVSQRVGAVEALVHDQAVELARELTEALVGHELRSSPDRADDVVRRVLAERPGDAPIVVHLHPGTLDVQRVAELAASGVRVADDPRLAADDAVLEVEDHVVDLRLTRQLERVREVLS